MPDALNGMKFKELQNEVLNKPEVFDPRPAVILVLFALFIIITKEILDFRCEVKKQITGETS